MKTERLEYPEIGRPCKAVADPEKLIKTEAVIPTDNGLFSDGEAAAEAARCIRCQCNACMKYCDVCAYHNKWPMKIRDEVMATVAFSHLAFHAEKNPGKKTDEYLHPMWPLRRGLPGKKSKSAACCWKPAGIFISRIPCLGHTISFGLMIGNSLTANSPHLPKKRRGQEGCTYAFFPGCQLGAAEPRYVKEPYQWLLSKKADTGLILRCCGVPAEWAGNEEIHGEEIATLRMEWESLGETGSDPGLSGLRKTFEGISSGNRNHLSL